LAQTNPGSFQVEWNDPGLTDRQVRLTLIGVMFAMFLASLDQTIVATAIPRIMADLDGFDRVTWVSSAYIVASTSVVLITGAVSDVYGRKWLFVGGISIFLIGSVLAASSQTMNALIVFRGIHGLRTSSEHRSNQKYQYAAHKQPFTAINIGNRTGNQYNRG
jgi:predicted MFS family arabinose efflux permease